MLRVRGREHPKPEALKVEAPERRRVEAEAAEVVEGPHLRPPTARKI
jgi:hypothetical protein